MLKFKIVFSVYKAYLMESNQIKLLSALAKKLKGENKDKEKAIASLQSAKILDRKGDFTKQYSNLEKIVVSTH